MPSLLHIFQDFAPGNIWFLFIKKPSDTIKMMKNHVVLVSLLLVLATLCFACKTGKNESVPGSDPEVLQLSEATEVSAIPSTETIAASEIASVPAPGSPAQAAVPGAGGNTAPAANYKPVNAAIPGRQAAPPMPSLSGIRARPGVYIGELDPVNYEKMDPAILLQMGLEQYHVSFIMGERYFKAGDYNKALAEFNRSVTLKSDFPVGFFSRGRTYYKRGDLDKAIADYTNVIKLEKDAPVVYNYRGYAYAEKGDQAKAIQDYTQAIALSSDYGDAWFNRAYSYREQGEYDKALADFSKLIQLEPKNAAAYNQRGIIWYTTGDNEKAIGDFSEAIKLNPKFPQAWHNRGIAYRAQGDKARSDKDLAEAARLGYK
jgi:Flp pilus assembly protein TadD